MALPVATLLMWLVFAPVDMAVAQAGGSAAVPPPPSTETLCVLDFDRLGDDPSLDWLQRGLADMMIGTMNRLSPYRVVERKHLRELLREHGLAASGLIDMDTAVRRARLAKAQVLLLGSFARQEDRLTIQARLIRISDQRILARAIWTEPPSDVLAAPRALSEALLARLGKPADRAQGDGIEHEIPRTIDVAKAYYAGLGAFDDGRYPEALAHYLDAARRAGDFGKVYPAVLEMYTLLGQGEHAVLFARRLARSYEEAGDVPSALEYHFAAAQQCLDALRDPGCAIESLEGLLRAVTRHEEKTGEIARTKRVILDRIGELHGTGQYESLGKILAERSIRYRVWPGDIDTELTRRAEEQARGGVAVLRDAKWVKEAVPRPSALMWKIRALRTLARAHAGLGAIERAFYRYRELLDEYEFLSGHPLSDGGHRDPIRAEAHFVLLHHHARTGQLLRNHALSEINRLNIVENRRGFDRDFGDRRPDARARVASRFKDRGYEYFDFAAPPGHQIDAVTLRATIEGIGVFGFNLPHPAGWPPRFSVSKRVTEFRFSKRGSYDRTVRLPPGVEFLSIGTSWGPGLYENDPAEVRHHQRFGPKDGPDIVRWQASFSVSRRPSATAKAGSDLRRLPGAPSAIDRYAAGWESAVVVRQPEAVVYAGNPSLDVYAEDWLVYAIDGEVQIFHRRDPRLKIRLPVTINTREPEREPALVRTHDGGYALLWARGTSTRTARRFVAFSRDLLSWETPQRMVFQDSPDKPGHTRLPEAPAERTTNVVPIRRGYVMLLAQGFARYSEDLRNWSPPQKVLPQDLHRNRLVKTRDGTVWAVYESSSDERQPYTPDDWLHGHFVVDGRPYRHVTELRVSRSVDGVLWQAAGKIVFPGQPSGLWAFPVSDRQVGVAVAFNNRFVKWLTASHGRDLRQIESPLPIMQHSDEAEFFVRDSSLVCARPVLDLEAQQSMLLATSSRALYERLAE